jgi:Second Messenger Oligonucleotide or Dinucleotide Synthetase domain
MELPSQFNRFIDNIKLTEAMRTDLIRGHKMLRERLSQDERLSKIYETTFLQGSYRRATAVRPRGDTRSDVDIVVVTNLDSSVVKPDSALDRFLPFLQRWYPGKYKAQGRSWGIELSYVDLDLVVTSAPSSAAREPLRRMSGDMTLEEQPDGPWDSSTSLQIPDRAAKEWVATHPIEQIRWTRDKNRRTNGHYLNVVRALKWWRRINDQPKYPKGYPLEHLIGDCCPNGITSVADGVTRTLETIAWQHAYTVSLGAAPSSMDRGVQQNVFTRISPTDFRGFYNLVVPAAKLARQAFDSRQEHVSAETWRALFGDKFTIF